MSFRRLTAHRCRWAVLILVACSWMSMGVLSDCDPAIADQVLTGVGSATSTLAGTLIEAMFDAIKPEERIPVTTSTMRTLPPPVTWMA